MRTDGIQFSEESGKAKIELWDWLPAPLLAISNPQRKDWTDPQDLFKKVTEWQTEQQYPILDGSSD